MEELLQARLLLSQQQGHYLDFGKSEALVPRNTNLT